MSSYIWLEQIELAIICKLECVLHGVLDGGLGTGLGF